jgi:hypothetical protein
MPFDLYNLAGMVGAVLIIAAYFATQQRWLSAEDWRFALANLVGAGFIIVSLMAAWNLAAFVIEVFWVLISLYGLAQSFRRGG